MSNRTFACLTCRKLQRKPATQETFRCPQCGGECLRVHWKLHVPAPRKVKKWNAFWAQYLLERRQIDEFYAGRLGDELVLPLLNRRLVRSRQGGIVWR